MASIARKLFANAGWFFLPSIALANTLSATGGLQFGRNSGMNDIKNSNPLVGASYSFGMGPHFELGGFYDYNFLSFQNGSPGSLGFMGVLLRYELARDHGFFGEIKLGLGQVSDTNLNTHSLPGYGIGAGYRFPISSAFSLGPRMDVRDLPVSMQGNSRAALMDFSLMLSLKL